MNVKSLGIKDSNQIYTLETESWFKLVPHKDSLKIAKQGLKVNSEAYLEAQSVMGIISSSIARKVAMALSGLFLVFFLGQHFVINATAVLSPDTFNSWSHFMGTIHWCSLFCNRFLFLG